MLYSQQLKCIWTCKYDIVIINEEGNNENLETLFSYENAQKSPKASVLGEGLWRKQSKPNICLYSWIPLE